MCRWIAYAGPEIYLEDLLFHQEYSIASQSLAARESVFTTNGDGFGVAWYGNRTAPGLFKDILPAWNDSNLRSIAAQIQTRLFFAHVRASTGTAVTRTNCHP
ncbi:MAG: class II glutamine amidotransferase, partial [Betaproteobacteria bacterium]